MKISEKQKKIIAVTAYSVFVIFCFAFIAVNIFKFVYDDRSAQVYQNEQYVIGVYQEKIAIFAQGDSVPVEIYDVYVSTLPEKDQKALRKGIEVQGRVKLRSLIEDYTS